MPRRPAASKCAPPAARRKLRVWLEANEWSQSDLAGAIGCTRAFVSQLMQGTCRPGYDLARDVERVTNGAVTAPELLG